MHERRKAPRRPAFWDAKIGFNGRRFRVNCMVQNISAGGARLALRQAVDLPPEFSLTIACKQERLEYGVRTKWRIRARWAWRLCAVRNSAAPQLRRELTCFAKLR
jgi:hypothetical protein